MTDPHQDSPAGGGLPDVNFSLGGVGGSASQSSPPLEPAAAAPEAGQVPVPDAPAPPERSLVDEESTALDTEGVGSSIEDQAGQLAQNIARELAVTGPEGWRRLESYFALTVAGGLAYTLYYNDADQGVRLDIPEEILEMARLHREVSAQATDGPWWRMVITMDVTGQVEADFDYGDVPFPDDQLFVPEAYLADLQAFPRERVPVWLAAYVGHDNRQWRTAQQAGVQARTDREAGIGAVRSIDDFPVLPVLWARWATIAASFVAVGSEVGPRVLPALALFEGFSRSGSTLYVLPGGRAVLSGGVWDAPELDAAYNGGEPMPDLYAGAPEWVANQVLNPRAARGVLSFCYWWDNGSWFRGESPTSDQLSSAVPGVWTAQTAAEVVAGLASSEPSDVQREAAANLVAAAEAGVVTRNTVVALFDDPADDIDGALLQLSMAGLVTEEPEQLSSDRAITLVREFIRGQDIDTTNYPLENLVAERLPVGWMVFVPTQPDEIAIGRAIFYIADDGVIEQSSSSVAPSVYAEGFEQRFNQRRTSTGVDFPI